MADSNTSSYLSKLPAQCLRTPSPLIQQCLHNFSSDFLHRAICFSVVIVLLSLFPSQASEHQSILARTWELLHLLFVGIAISYGLFSRRNLDFDAGKETPRAKAADDSESYLSDMLHVPSVFDDGDDDFYGVQGSLDETKSQTWNSLYRRNDPVVMFANEGAGRNLSLPVRSLKSHVQELDSGEKIMESLDDSNMESFDSQMVETGEDEEESSRGIVFPPSSSSFSLPPPPPPAFNGDSKLPKTSSFRSSKTPSPKRPSFSPEMRAKSSEDLRNTKTLYDFSPPPAPPPLPPFAGHGNPSTVERKITQRRFKDELKDWSRMVRKGGQYHTDIVFDLFESSAKRNGFSASKDVLGGVDSEKKWGYEAHRPESMLSVETEEKNEFMEKVVVSPPAVDSDKDNDEEEEEQVEESSVKEEKVLQTAAKVGGANENEVDKKADEFIAKFRKQMTLQRFEAAKC